MPSNQQEALMSCGCCGANCPCCPGWPLSASGSIRWVITSEASDCGGGSAEVTTDFGCPGVEDETGWLVLQEYGDLYVRVFCSTDPDTGENTWFVQYRSPTSGGGFEIPASATWLDAVYTFVCPDCADAVGGIATGSIEFTARSACEISGPTIVEYDVLCSGIVEIGCP